ncbi:MAG: VCP-like ATPase [Candidatus Heimdallarchaeota archaeon LC_3]|nr:MAG: VCP-like ATPase [Candidatus Heimdallarchaeota archaeon LC_3]
MEETEVKIAEARQQDVGRGICRLDPEVAKSLGISTGDIVEISSPDKKTAAKSWHGYPDDKGKGIIRIDGATRRNAEVSIDDKVKIKRIEAKDATKISFSPTDPLRIQGGEAYLRRILENRVLTAGDYIEIPIMGRKIVLMVTGHIPKAEAILVRDTTTIEISDKVTTDSRLPKITYEDIGGLHEEIRKVREMIELPMKHPELFERLGIEAPKGVLLHGPPGTGKTLLAKAVANETDSNFISLSGPEIMSKFYGESEKKLREIFRDAEKNAPSIIFIDEIDSIAPKREEVTGEVERRVVAQLLALMDGLEGRGQVVIIGATNRPNALDPALRRGGRFDREIEIGIPNREARLEIITVHSRGMPLDDDVILEEIASITHGFVGADLQALAKEAAMNALRRILPEIDLEQESIPATTLEKIVIDQNDFSKALAEVAPSALREVFVEIPNITWDDIGGLKSIKEQLREIVEWPIKYGKLFRKMKAKQPKGVLLFGAPGSGKTLIAKAVANESQANFISVKGPEFLSKWVGESEKAVREIFRKARQAAPCIVFFDEIETITPTRGAMSDSHVTERVISQLLTELDGLEELHGVMIIAATNRADLIDPALLRPGRFDKIIEIPLPEESERAEIFSVHLKGKDIADDTNISELAKLTEGFSGADIEAIVSEATISAIREFLNKYPDGIEKNLSEEEENAMLEESSLTYDHFKNALDKVTQQKQKLKQTQLKIEAPTAEYY